MKVYIKTLNTFLLFLLIVPSYISAAQQQTPPLVQAKPLSSAKKSSKEWWKNPWVYVASASLVATAVIGTFFGIQVAKTGVRKPESKTTQPDKIEAIVETPSPQEEQQLKGLSPLELYKNHVNEMESASLEDRAKFQLFVYAFIHDLITKKYQKSEMLEPMIKEMDTFMQREFPTLRNSLNKMNEEERNAALQAKFTKDAYFTWRYFSELNPLCIQAIENSGNNQIMHDLVEYLGKHFIMQPKNAMIPQH